MKAFLETWRPIPGQEGKYEVSDHGCILDVTKGNIKKPCRMKKGYLRAYIKGCSQTLVHRIVYTAFVGDIPQGMQIDHINGVKDDNRLCNLRCVTPKENSNNPVTAVKNAEAIRQRTQSPEWREKNRERMKRLWSDPEFRGKQREGAKRMAQSPEWQKNNHEARRRVAKAVLQLDRHTGEVIKRWECISDAQRALGIHGITECCRGRLRRAGQFKWKYDE